jgi:hypothetical protein
LRRNWYLQHSYSGTGTVIFATLLLRYRDFCNTLTQVPWYLQHSYSGTVIFATLLLRYRDICNTLTQVPWFLQHSYSVTGTVIFATLLLSYRDFCNTLTQVPWYLQQPDRYGTKFVLLHFLPVSTVNKNIVVNSMLILGNL